MFAIDHPEHGFFSFPVDRRYEYIEVSTGIVLFVSDEKTWSTRSQKDIFDLLMILEWKESGNTLFSLQFDPFYSGEDEMSYVLVVGEMSFLLSEEDRYNLISCLKKVVK